MAESGERRSLFDRTVGSARRGLESQVVGSARGVVDDLEPYLAAETVPRLVDALVPHLAAETVPRLVEELMPYLVEEVVPEVVDGVTEHLATTTAPVLLERLTPLLADEVVPEILERLRPYLEAELVPAIVDSLTPHLVRTTAPQLIKGLMPRITSEIVPAVLDGIADDPRVRRMVRDQSFGAATELAEHVRRLLASGDETTERLVRRALLQRGPVTDPEPAAELPVGRLRSHAGLASRLTGSLLDLALVSFLGTVTVASIVSILDALVDTVPQWAAAALTVGVGLLGPAYLVLSWVLFGRTVGAFIAGYAVVARDGTRLGLVRAVLRAVLVVVLPLVWIVGLLASALDPQRRGLLDRVVGSRTPYRTAGRLVVVQAIPEASIGRSTRYT